MLFRVPPVNLDAVSDLLGDLRGNKERAPDSELLRKKNGIAKKAVAKTRDLAMLTLGCGQKSEPSPYRVR